MAKQKRVAIEPYKIEKGIALPQRSNTTHAVEMVDEMVQSMAVGDSMVIFKKNKSTIMKHLKSHYPKNKFVFSDLTDKTHTRFWLRG